MPVCGQCGQDNPEGFRFCGACGAELAAAPAPAREVRKIVTVLFCDVTGSTALGERLDPESLRRVMARYFEAARAALERHGGSVEKFIGDAVMAVFGVPQSHEDDALRALRSAVELREAIAVMNGALERDYGVTLQVRIGVNTGEVVTGTEERLATGDAVNVAARLEQAAAPGEILIGEQTLQLARDAVEVDDVEPVAAKGKVEPVTAFRVLAVAEGGPAVKRRLDAPIVGRARELELLRQAFERAADERACHLFTVLGPAGVGKSRLVQEAVETIGGRATVLTGRCLPYGEGITYWPLLEVFREAGAESELDHALAAGSSEETFWAVRTWLEARAREHPLVLVLDDLHWAEPTLLDLVEHVADLSRGVPLLLVCVARPEFLDGRPGWAGGKLNATSILLEPLADEESAELVVNLGGEELGDATRDRIVEAAEGNPLFVEEMLAMVAEGGDGEVDVPPTIQALIAARLDRLKIGERQVVERAAVEGKVFHRAALEELVPQELRLELSERLTSLVRKELIRPDLPVFSAADAFRFRHLLIRDAAYASLPKELRAALHERFARWLERVVRTRIDDYGEIVGYHLEQAYRYRSDLGPLDDPGLELGWRAAKHLTASGQRARNRGDFAAAANLLGRAHAILPAGSRESLELTPDLAACLVGSARYEQAKSVIERGRDLAAAAGDARTSARLEVEAGYVATHVDPGTRMADVVSDLERSIQVLEEAGDDRALARAWTLEATLTFWLGQNGAALRGFERAHDHALRSGDRTARNDALWWRAGAAYYGPMPADQGARFCEDLRDRLTGYAYGQWFVLLIHGCFEAMRGRFDEARALRAEAVAVMRKLGAVHELAGDYQIGAEIELLAGDAAGAADLLRRGCEHAERTGETGYLSTTAAMLGEALYRQGLDAEALEATALSERSSAPDDRASHIQWRAVRAKVLARRGERAEAARLARDAVGIAEETDCVNMRGEALLALAIVECAAQAKGKAVAAAREAVELYDRKGNLASAGRARALLAELEAQPPATA